MDISEITPLYSKLCFVPFSTAKTKTDRFIWKRMKKVETAEVHVKGTMQGKDNHKREKHLFEKDLLQFQVLESRWETPTLNSIFENPTRQECIELVPWKVKGYIQHLANNWREHISFISKDKWNTTCNMTSLWTVWSSTLVLSCNITSWASMNNEIMQSCLRYHGFEEVGCQRSQRWRVIFMSKTVTPNWFTY